MLLLLRLIRESYLFAFQAIIVNKVRTILSLLGITIGIFCIISVFTIFDSMESFVRKSIDSLGSNVVYIQKWPWAMGGDYPWWKYYQRPEATLEDMKEVQKRSSLTEAVSFMVGVSKTVKYHNNYMQNCEVLAVSNDYDKVTNFEMGDGRYISQLEFSSGKNVAVIGETLAKDLFQEIDPVGKKIKVFGLNLDVVGVFKKQGEDMFGLSNDNRVVIPINFGRNVINFNDIGTTIIVKAKPGISTEQLIDELTGIMRSIRKLKPQAEDNFAINESSVITKGFDSLFAVIGMVGWIVGGFSLLVGGFGIANIMFVSVRERTNIIGIQKALGAKNYFILLEFLFEAVFLSLLGGIVGLLIVFLLSVIISAIFDMGLVLTIGNIMLGIGVSAVIGLVSGIIPAYSASRLDPVEAMRTGT